MPRTLTLRRALALGTIVTTAGFAAGAGTLAAVRDGDRATADVTRAAAPSPASLAASRSLGVNGVYRLARDGVVDITVRSAGADTPSPSGSQTSSAEGSGFVYDTSGHIVTNQHVVDGASSIVVRFADGTKATARLVGSDASTDLAVLSVDVVASKLHPLALASSGSLEVGDGVVAIGSPFGLEQTVTSGIVSALGRRIASPSGYTIGGAIQTDAAINHGNSGGPLLDLQGAVVGVNAQIESDSGGNDGVGFAIPASTVRSVAKQIVSSGKAEHAYLGVGVATAANGVRLTAVRTATPAAGAGLRVGDVVTSLGGHAVATSEQLQDAIAARAPGDEVTLRYRRDGASHSARLTLTTRPT